MYIKHLGQPPTHARPSINHFFSPSQYLKVPSGKEECKKMLECQLGQTDVQLGTSLALEMFNLSPEPVHPEGPQTHQNIRFARSLRKAFLTSSPKRPFPSSGKKPSLLLTQRYDLQLISLSCFQRSAEHRWAGEEETCSACWTLIWLPCLSQASVKRVLD